MKRAIIAGGTGHIGSSLAKRLVELGYEVNVLTRAPIASEHPAMRYTEWDGETIGAWTKYLDESDIVINFCGKSVDCRYTESNKLKLIQSRVRPTQLLGRAINNSLSPPKVWVNASSSAYYGFSTNLLDETATHGNDFPARICVEWEKAFFNSQTPATRKVAWRLGVVLQQNKGLVLPFKRLVKSFLGGKLGSGKQYFTWIDEEDFLNAAVWTIENSSVVGAYNLTSPKPVMNEVFMKALRKSIGIPIGISLPAWLLQIGGKIIGTEPYLILDGRRIIPGKLEAAGFQFKYPDIQDSVDHLFNGKSNGI